MKPHPRPPIIRKTIKWGGAAVTVLLVVVWVGSGRWHYLRTRPSYFLSVGEGTLVFGGVPSESRLKGAASFWRADSFSLSWGGGVGRSSWRTTYAVPLWIFPLVSIPFPIVSWRLDTLARRRAKLNLCPKCGYDRTGILQDAKCPECGAAAVRV